MNSLRKTRISATNRPVSPLEPCLTSLSGPAGLFRVPCVNPPKQPLPWRASPGNFPTTSPPTRPRRWWRPLRATRSGWACALCSGQDYGCPNARPSRQRTFGSPRTRPLPAKPRRPRREGSGYQWAGTRNLFLTCESRRGWRYVAVTRQCTMQDFAHQMRCLLQRGQCPPAFITFADVSPACRNSSCPSGALFH